MKRRDLLRTLGLGAAALVPHPAAAAAIRRATTTDPVFPARLPEYLLPHAVRFDAVKVGHYFYWDWQTWLKYDDRLARNWPVVCDFGRSDPAMMVIDMAKPVEMNSHDSYYLAARHMTTILKHEEYAQWARDNEFNKAAAAVRHYDLSADGGNRYQHLVPEARKLRNDQRLLGELSLTGKELAKKHGDL